MLKAYLYLASDGILDFKKFGITSNPIIRLINYNSTEHLRPIYFEKVFVFESYSDARNFETLLRGKLKKYITQTSRIETFEWNEITEEIFNSITKDLTEVEFSNDYLGNVNNKKFPYHSELMNLIQFAIDSKVPNKTIEKFIIETRTGYFKENTPPRVVMENRVKPLIKLTNKELFWDNKPSLNDRMSRLYNLEDKIKKLISSF
jgi:hypothetical protein